MSLAKIVIHTLRCTPIASAPGAAVREDAHLACVQSPSDLARCPVREHCVLGISGGASPTDEEYEIDGPQKIEDAAPKLVIFRSSSMALSATHLLSFMDSWAGVRQFTH